MKKIFCIFVICVGCAFGATFPLEIEDSGGHKVVIPKEPRRIVVGGGMWPLPSVIVMLDSSASRLVYIPKASMSAMKNSFLLDFYPEIAHIKSGNSENIEELLMLKPDLFICHSANVKICEAMRKSKVPTLEISVSKWEYNSLDTLKGWLDIIAPILNQEAKAQEIIEWSKNAQIQSAPQNAAQNTAQSLPQNPAQNPPRALIIHRFDNPQNISTKIGVGGLFADYLLESSGAQSVVHDKSAPTLSLEQIYALNPDIIYINNFNPIMPKDLLESKLYQPLKAVKEKRVYKFPLGSYRPFAPSVDLPILLLWLRVCHGEKGIDLKAQTHKYYKEVFGLDLSPKQVESIFAPSKNAGVLE